MSLKQKLENIKSRLRSGGLTKEDAKALIDSAPSADESMESQMRDIQQKLNAEAGLDTTRNTTGELLDTSDIKKVIMGTDGSRFDNTKGAEYMLRRGEGIDQNVEGVLGVQGGTSADLLDKTNRHQINMMMIDPVSKLLQALALKNIL